MHFVDAGALQRVRGSVRGLLFAPYDEATWVIVCCWSPHALDEPSAALLGGGCCGRIGSSWCSFVVRRRAQGGVSPAWRNEALWLCSLSGCRDRRVAPGRD